MATVENKPVHKETVITDVPLRFVPTPVRGVVQQIRGIHGFIDTSFLDWDNMMSAVIFMGSCNMNCPFCHDHELFGSDVEPIPFDAIRSNLVSHRGWIDGVVVTGGEPTCHSCLPKLFAELKSMGFATKLDTNGTRPDILQELARDGLIDYVAMDVKASLSTRPVDNRGTTSYARAAGVPVRLDDIRESIEFLLEGHVEYEFRTTVVPTIVGRTDIEDIASTLAGAHAYFLQPFEPHNARDSALRNVRPYSEQELALLLDLVRKYVPPATLRGAVG